MVLDDVDFQKYLVDNYQDIDITAEMFSKILVEVGFTDHLNTTQLIS